MPLLDLWKSNADAVAKLSIEQVVATAGDGVLRDKSACSQELHSYISEISLESLAAYVNQCLNSKIEKGGLILQDLVNELGRRLDYNVTNGLYQGTSNAVGFDGIWLSPDGNTIITEVKTTDTYRISLDKLAEYRRKLLAIGVIKGEASILIVVGRQDTGEVEAQIRGSRHAWDVRLVSAEALIKLARLKLESDEQTGRKIRSVLMPLEYTRLDRLVDVMFSTVTDVASNVDQIAVPDVGNSEPKLAGGLGEIASSSSGVKGTWEFTDPAQLQGKRSLIVLAMSKRLGEPIIKRSRALFWSADHHIRLACTISKKYSKPSSYPYWYAFHPRWAEFLSDFTESFFILGCMDLDQAFAIPYVVIRDILPDLNVTENDGGMYWHINIINDTSIGLALLVPKRDKNLSIAEYSLQLS